jgi:hypothetical protein
VKINATEREIVKCRSFDQGGLARITVNIYLRNKVLLSSHRIQKISNQNSAIESWKHPTITFEGFTERGTNVRDTGDGQIIQDTHVREPFTSLLPLRAYMDRWTALVLSRKAT